MMDSDLEAIDDTFEEEAIEDREDDTLDDDFSDEIEDGETPDEEQPEAEAEGEEPEADAEDSDDQVRVTLDSGEETTLAELKRGYFREKDYTQKTTEIASERAALSEKQQAAEHRAQQVDHTFNNLVQFAQSIIPPEPDLVTAQSDPAGYQYAKAMRESVIAEVSQLFQMQEGFEQAKQQFSQEDMAAMKREADAELVKAMPQLKEPSVRAAFDAENVKTASEFGFSEQEIQSTADPRILQLVHYARLGKRAETNQRNAKRRVESPKKGKARPMAKQQAGAKNHKATERLRKSGSILDAMSIDFD